MRQLRGALALLCATTIVNGACAQEVPKLSANLNEIANIKTIRSFFELTKSHVDALRKNWFFTSPSKDELTYTVYGVNDYNYIPSFVTTDNALELLHVIYDTTIKEIETTKLSPGARKMSAALLAVAVKDWKAAKGTRFAQAAAKNVAYFGVADRLSGGQDPIPASVTPMVTETVAMIGQHGGFEICPIFPYEIDFSQFVPRGHYATTVVLRRYFQTMMWFGLTPLAAPAKPGDSYVPIQQALLLSHELSHSGQLPRWNRMYDVTSLLVGPSNHLTPLECETVAKTVFGPTPAFADWTNTDKLRTFVDRLGKSRPAKFVAEDESGVGPGGVQVRFMGQRNVPDSYVLQTLACPQRGFPSPLDVMTTLGSKSALRILNASPAKYNPDSWPDYIPRRDRLVAEFAAYGADQWKSDLYWSWMDCLRQIVRVPERSNQPCMNTQAWDDRSLFSALASWAQMRHDTILYGQQPSVAEGGDDEEKRAPNEAKGFVEPNLPFYETMKNMVDVMQTELEKRTYLSASLRGQYVTLKKLLDFLSGVSKKELSGKWLSETEYKRIRAIEADFEDLHNSIQKSQLAYQTLTAEDYDPATVADFDTFNDTCQEAGTGRADELFAIVKIEGKLYIARGATMSYFEFKRPSSDRMTDHAWKVNVSNGDVPPREAWVKSFFVPTEVMQK